MRSLQENRLESPGAIQYTQNLKLLHEDIKQTQQSQNPTTNNNNDNIIINNQDNLKQRNSLGKLSTVILRGTSDEPFISSNIIKNKSQTICNNNNNSNSPQITSFNDAANKEDNHSKLIKYLKEQKKTKHAAEFLIQQFSEFRFFKQIMRQLSDDLLKQIIFELKLETYKKHQIIFQYNDVGRHMYFILSGKVAILIPSKPNVSEVNTPISKVSTPTVSNDNNLKEQQQQQLQQQQQSFSVQSQVTSPQINSSTKNQQQTFSQASQITFLNPPTPNNNNSSVINNFRDYLIRMVGQSQVDNLKDEEEFEYFRQYKLSHFKQVNTVLAGNSFGEVALEQRIPRTASTVTITPCQLATLSYDSFRKLLSKIYERIQNEQRSFLKEIPPFNNWPNAGIMVIYNNSEEIEYQINNVIYKEGDRCQYIYFIKEGEIEINKIFKIDKCDTITLQKKNIVTKRQVIQRVAQGRMFGDFEGILHLLDPKKKNNMLFNSKSNESLPLRETQAVCQTKVKLMRIDSRIFFLNFWAFNNPEDQQFFQAQRKNMMDKVNNIQKSINDFQNSNIESQEINQLSEMLQLNSLLQSNTPVSRRLHKGASSSISISASTPFNILSPSSIASNTNKSNQPQKINIFSKNMNNSKNNPSNDTTSSDFTTPVDSPMKRSSSINIHLNQSPSSSSGSRTNMNYFSNINPQISQSLLQAAQQNKLLVQPSLFQRLQNLQQAENKETIYQTSRSSEQLPSPSRNSQRKSTYSQLYQDPNNLNNNNSNNNNGLGNSHLVSPLQKRLTVNLQHSEISSPKISEQIDSSLHQQRLSNFNNDQKEIDLKNDSKIQKQNEQNIDQDISCNNLEQNQQNQESNNIQKQQQNNQRSHSNQQSEQKNNIHFHKRTQSNNNNINIKKDKDQQNQKAKKEQESKQQLLLDQPLKIFQLKDSRRLKVLRKDIEDKFQQWRDQDNGKKIIRKKNNLTLKLNNQSTNLFNQIQNSLSTKNPSFDKNILQQLAMKYTKNNNPQTDRPELNNNNNNHFEINDKQYNGHESARNIQEETIPSQIILQNNNHNNKIQKKNKRTNSAVFLSNNNLIKHLIHPDQQINQNISFNQENQGNSETSIKHQNNNNNNSHSKRNSYRQTISVDELIEQEDQDYQFDKSSPTQPTITFSQFHTPNHNQTKQLHHELSNKSNNHALSHQFNNTTSNYFNSGSLNLLNSQLSNQQNHQFNSLQSNQYHSTLSNLFNSTSNQFNSPLNHIHSQQYPQLNNILQHEALSPLKIISVSHDTQLNNLIQFPLTQDNNTNNNNINSLNNKNMTQSQNQNIQQLKDMKLNKTGNNFYKFQIMLQNKQNEQDFNRIVKSTQQTKRNFQISELKLNKINKNEYDKNNNNIINSPYNNQDSQRTFNTTRNTQSSRPFSILHYETIKSDNKLNHNGSNNCLSPTLSHQQNNIDDNEKTDYINQLTLKNNIKKEIHPLQSLSSIDQHLPKQQQKQIQTNQQFKNEIRSLSQPSIVNFRLQSQESIVSPLIIKENKQKQHQIKCLIQPLSAINTPTHIKKKQNDNNNHNLITLQQASKLPPTIKNNNLQDSNQINKKQQKGSLLINNNIDINSKDNKSLGCFSYFDLESNIMNQQITQQCKTLKTFAQLNQLD